jgi:hypothetical protein
MTSITLRDLEKLRQAHKEGRFAEFKRARRFGSSVTGYLIAYSEEVLVIEELNWDSFQLNGIVVLPRNSIKRLRIFEQTDWPINAARQLRLTKSVVIRGMKKKCGSIIREIIGDSRLFEVESNQMQPDEMLLVEYVDSTESKMRVKNYDATLKQTDEVEIMFKDITRLVVRDGYCRAAELALGLSESMVDISPATP